MYLNTLKPAEGSNKPAKRAGRGIGSGIGKTGGRGHKGQLSRSGGKVRAGFEGGQMPLKQRLPKFGFTSRKSLYSSEVRLSEIDKLAVDTVTIESLKDANLVKKHITDVKVFLSGEINRAVTLTGIRVSAGARKAIEAAGGKVA